MNEYKPLYRRKLPHYHMPGANLFVTFRLANSIPREVVRHYRNQKLAIDNQLARLVGTKETGEIAEIRSNRLKDFHRTWFRKFEQILHQENNGHVWLKNPEIASLVFESFMHRDNQDFDLKALCIMSNHVHSVFRPNLTHDSITVVKHAEEFHMETDSPTLGVIMKSLKGYTARMANRLLGRTGKFWEVESYDHQVRDKAEFHRIVRYVLQNPVKAGLVRDWRDWKWTYLAEELRPFF